MDELLPRYGEAMDFKAGDMVPGWVLRAPKPDLQRTATFATNVRAFLRSPMSSLVIQTSPGDIVIRVNNTEGGTWGEGQVLTLERMPPEAA